MIAGGMLVAGLAVPAAAQESAGQVTCQDDLGNDTRVHEAGSPSEDDAPTVEPRADITRYCVTSGPQASFHVTIADPTDPASDPGWQRATFLGWFVDTDGDDAGDYFIDFSLDATGSFESARTAQVVRGANEDEGTEEEVMCEAAVQVTDSGYAVSGVDAACFEGATDIQAQPAMYYDNGSVIAYDRGGDWVARDIEATDRITRRLAGETRVGTSVAISQERFEPGEARTAYLSRDDVFADAAVGGVLTDGPILIVPSCGEVPDIVRAEIERLEVGVVTALGETQAICEQMLDSAAEGLAKDRIGGATRFHTSVEIANEAFPTADRVYLARSDEFIDAVAGGTLTDGPIMLVPKCGEVPAVVDDAIDAYAPDEVVALGGPVAICDDTLAAAAGGADTSRVAGETRYGTAIEIAQYVFPEPTARQVYLARADLVVDALAGGTLTEGPVLVVDSCGDFEADAHLHAVAEEITRNAPDEVVALGGPVAICDETLAQAGGF